MSTLITTGNVSGLLSLDDNALHIDDTATSDMALQIENNVSDAMTALYNDNYSPVWITSSSLRARVYGTTPGTVDLTGSGFGSNSGSITSIAFDPDSPTEWNWKIIGGASVSSSGLVKVAISGVDIWNDTNTIRYSVRGSIRSDANFNMYGTIKSLTVIAGDYTLTINGSIDANAPTQGVIRKVMLSDTNGNSIVFGGAIPASQLEQLMNSASSVGGLFDNQALLSGRDVMVVTTNSRAWYGFDGSDVITGGQLNDTLDGGNGNDKLIGQDGDDSLLGGAGNDFIDGGNGGDTINGGDGNDKLVGLAGDDSLTGGLGNDQLMGGDGNDTLDGGEGNDRYIDLSGNNAISDSGGNNNITLGTGDDTVTTGAGNDVIRAGDGNNAIVDGGGNNRIISGAGNDTITGGSGNDVITAGDGNNSIVAGGGNDRVTTGAGNDTLTGNDGADMLVTGAGNDVLDGGAGADTLIGGLGSDTFVFSSASDGTADMVKDFRTSDGDKLSLSPLTFTALSGASDVQGRLVSAAGATALDADDFLVFDTTTHKLYYDADGNGAGGAVLVATLAGVASLSASDIVLA